MANAFRLLIRTPVRATPDARVVTLGGSSWTLAEYDQIPSPQESCEFTCISYSWGRGRMTNPLGGEFAISDRTVPAIEATVRALEPSAIWIDSLCVPPDGPARDTCLRSMGTIYGAAKQVVAVLSKPCAPILESIQTTHRLDAASFPLIEQDDWVSRAWTYQEIANCRSILFVGEGSGSAVEGIDVFRALVKAISDYKKAEGIEAFEFRTRHPRLDSLEDLFAEYMITGYQQKFAYQLMASMGGRFAEREEDLLNAMLGAITSEPGQSPKSIALTPSERFMRACEARGDYSFIYSAAQRSTDAGLGWRPAGDRIPVILSWHTYGTGQAGSPHSTHLQLNDMCRMKRGVVSADAHRHMTPWLQDARVSSSGSDIADVLFERLRRIGFNGSGQWLETESGYFFPHTARNILNDDLIAVASGVRWAQGGPGLLLSPGGADIHRFRDVGVFVGVVPKTGEFINVC
jgi:hypothetical protein